MRSGRRWRFMGMALAAAPVTCLAQFNLGGGDQYAILYEGNGGHTLQITNVTVDGNIGVGLTGQATDSGPATIDGAINFSAANTGQFSNNNGSNVITGGENYSASTVSNALTWVNSMSSTLAGFAGTGIAINGMQTVSASSGSPFTLNGQTVHVFDATSFNNNGTSDVLTISGSSSDLVVINLGGLGNIQFHGGIAFAGGITADNVIFNIGGSGNALDINNNGGADGLAQGIFLDPDGVISVTHADVDGRVFGGDSQDFQLVSGTRFTGHSRVVAPEPFSTSLCLAAAGLYIRRRRSRRT